MPWQCYAQSATYRLQLCRGRHAGMWWGGAISSQACISWLTYLRTGSKDLSPFTVPNLGWDLLELCLKCRESEPGKLFKVFNMFGDEKWPHDFAVELNPFVPPKNLKFKISSEMLKFNLISIGHQLAYVVVIERRLLVNIILSSDLWGQSRLGYPKRLSLLNF
jgi:hypothetical protein